MSSLLTHPLDTEDASTAPWCVLSEQKVDILWSLVLQSSRALRRSHR